MSPRKNHLDLPGRHPGLHQLLGLFGVPPVRVFQRRAGDSIDGGGVGCGARGDGLRCTAGRPVEDWEMACEWLVNGL